MAKTKAEVEQQTKNDRLWESLDYSYGKNSDAIAKSYDQAFSQASNQLLKRGMQRSAYGTQQLANIEKQKIDAQEDNRRALIADYQNRLTDLENQEAARDLQERQFAESQRQFNENLAYNKDRAAASDNQFTLQFNEGQRQFDLGQALAREQLAENQRQYNETQAYNRERANASDNQWNLSFNYQQERDKVGDTQWERQFAEGVRQFDVSHNGSSGGAGGKSPTPTQPSGEKPAGYTHNMTYGQWMNILGGVTSASAANASTNATKRIVELKGPVNQDVLNAWNAQSALKGDDVVFTSQLQKQQEEKKKLNSMKNK